AVIEDLMKETLVASGQTVASWYVVFSANEMVVVVEKGNALGIRHVEDLAKPEVKFVRVTGGKDLATTRTIEFLNRASSLCAFRRLRPVVPAHRDQCDAGA
ncbi:MAG TPA: substrate-binding domain-containing protein, partial [Pseudolabrys sp.]